MRVFRCIKEFEVPYRGRDGSQQSFRVEPGAVFTTEDDTGEEVTQLSGILLACPGKIGVSRKAIAEYFEELTK